MIKKDLSEKDQKDWLEYLDNLSTIPNKDQIAANENKNNKKFKYDFHGYTIENANKKMHEIIEKCSDNDINEILIITGKGMHSNTAENVYVSENLSKLRHSIPEYITNHPDLKTKILNISEAGRNFGGSGALLIKLKKIIK